MKQACGPLEHRSDGRECPSARLERSRERREHVDLGSEYIVTALEHTVQGMDGPSNGMAVVRKQLEQASGAMDDNVDPLEQASMTMEGRSGELVEISSARAAA